MRGIVEVVEARQDPATGKRRTTPAGRAGVRWIAHASALVASLIVVGPVPVSAAEEISLVRLTPAQYERAIHDIFGESIQVDDGVGDPGVRENGLLALGARKLALSAAALERYEALAQQVAAQVTDPSHRATLIPCLPDTNTAPDQACATQFVTRVGLFLFRRPPTDDEVRSYVAIADSAADTLDDFYAGVRAALVGMLVAPEFLFRTEYTEPDPAEPETLRLDAYSRASRLSFFLWNSTPDTELLAAAQSGALLSTDGLHRQIERLLSSPRVEDGLRAFFSDMLGFDGFATLSVDPSLYPKFTKNVQDDAREQTLRTIADHLIDKDGDYRDLFVTRDTFLTPSLAAIYGVPLPRSQELGGAVPWVPYRFPEGDPHVGLLTQVSFLALHSHPGTTSPTLRGKAVRENLLCQRVPPPPGDVDFTIVQDTANPAFRTVRQRLTAHRDNPTCAGCHRLTDPIGLTLEVFDASGVYRTTENGALIDTSGNFRRRPYAGVTEFATILRDDPAATSCLVNRTFSYGTARIPTDRERTWLADTASALIDTGVTWRDLMRRIAQNVDFYTHAGG